MSPIFGGPLLHFISTKGLSSRLCSGCSSAMACFSAVLANTRVSNFWTATHLLIEPGLSYAVLCQPSRGTIGNTHVQQRIISGKKAIKLYPLHFNFAAIASRHSLRMASALGGTSGCFRRQSSIARINDGATRILNRSVFSSSDIS